MTSLGHATSRVDYKPRDYIELPMRKSERFTLLSKEGEFWFIARNARGKEGYIPAAHVVVDGQSPSHLLYRRWRESCDTLFNRGQIAHQDWTALAVPKELRKCTKLECSAWKDGKDGEAQGQAALRACVHDVELLLKVEPAYGAEWLKAERVRWHPDRFGTRCTPEARQVLGRRAADMFTVLTKLYEMEVEKAALSGRAPQMDRPT